MEHMYLWSPNVFSLDVTTDRSNQSMCALISVAFFRFRYLAWSSSAIICLHCSCPQGPSHSQRRRKLSLVVSGQGGSVGRAGKHRLLLSSTASPFAGLNFQLKAC